MKRQEEKGEKALLNLREASDALHVTTKTGREWIVTGKLKALRAGHAYLIPKSEIDRLLKPVEAKGRGQAPEK